MSYQSHQSAGQAIFARCGVVTLSDTRTVETDKTGRCIQDLLSQAGHSIVRYELMRDEPEALKTLLHGWLKAPELDLVITNGGTGVSPRDNTIDVLESFLDQPLPGFGELFRMLSWEQIGSGAMLSRAAGGVAMGKLLFGVPGSTAAAELAVKRLLVPEVGHLLAQIRGA